MKILPIASGKGGVGKSLFAANVAIALAEAGKDVILIDLDLGGSNLHLILGEQSGNVGIGSFLNKNTPDFADIIKPTDVKRLRFVAGDAEIPGLANLSALQKRALGSRIAALQADFVILDLGAGSSLNTLDFFQLSNHGIIVTAPTPTATVNAYLFLKNVVFRMLQSCFKRDSPAAAHLAKLRADVGSLQRVYVMDLVRHVQSIDPASYEAFAAALQAFRPRLVMNMITDPKEAEKVNKLRRSCRQYLGLDMEHLGVMYRDDLQDIALSARLPIIRYKPKSVLSQAIYRIADKIIQSDLDETIDTHRPGTWGIDESYETAEMEAEQDFNTKVQYVEDLLHTGALTLGDLVETVKTQQIEITHLRKENALIKAKLMRAVDHGYRL